MNCGTCGAVADGYVCHYCGNSTEKVQGSQDEMPALAEFHQMLDGHDKEKQVELLRNGFLPSDTQALIEAGLRCIPLLHSEEYDTITPASKGRLLAIVTKLRLMKPDAQIERAVTEFERNLKQQKKASRRVDLIILIMGLIILAGIVWVIWYFTKG